MAKHALVVDDSKLARVVLKNMLADRGIIVDTVETAEEALGYLCMNRPDVIFMDHIMPGMNGLQAVEAIKEDPSTATIPILMYTSKEGEVYMSQARAFGAVGVLPKQLKPVDLETVLDNLKLLSSPESIHDGANPEAPSSQASKPGFIDIDQEENVDLNDLAQKAQDTTIGLSIRSTVKRMLQTNNRRLRQEFRLVALEIAETLERNQTLKKKQSNYNNWFALGGLVILLVFGGAWFSIETHKLKLAIKSTSEELARLKSANEQRSGKTAPVKFMSAHPTQPKSSERATEVELPEWLMNGKNTYKFNQKPFDNQQLRKLSKLVSQLANQRFKGSVRLISHVGEFCVQHDEMGKPLLPDDKSAVALCDVNTHGIGEARYLGMQQSQSFTNFINNYRPGNKLGIEIEIATKGKDNPLFVYQDDNQIETAGDWNKVARLNNRVEYMLVPATR